MPDERALDQAEIAAYWQRASAYYDDITVGAPPPTATQNAWALQFRRALGPPPRRVCEIGSGTGWLTLKLLAAGYEVVIVDIAERMLEACQTKVAAAGFEVEAHVGSAESLPLPDDSVDAVTSHLVLWTLLHPEDCVRDWGRVTRPGGRVTAFDGLHGRRQSVAERLRFRAFDVVSRLTGNGEPGYGYMYEPGRLSQLPLWKARDIGEVRDVFSVAGLDDPVAWTLDGVQDIERRSRSIRGRLLAPSTDYVVMGAVGSSMAVH
ncbi:MAG: class I SAM-dependent methyltransferase [Actinomycetota bacterium]